MKNNLSHLKIGLIADDFTGAMDSGAQFAGIRPIGLDRVLEVSFRFAGYATSAVEIINTASREIPVGEAFQRNQEAARRLDGRLLFKKIDSTMRGHISEEVEAILSASPYRKAVICPAAPLQGRVVLDGKLLVNGFPLQLTSFKDDPVYPAITASLSELLQRQVTHLSLELIRSVGDRLARAIDNAPSGTLFTADTETQQDLNLLAEAIVHTDALPCGAFGLAKAYMAALGGEMPLDRNIFSIQFPALVVVGSANRVAHQQVEELMKNPRAVQFLLDACLPANLEKEILQAGDRGAQVIVLSALQQHTLRVPEWLGFGKTISQLSANLLNQNLAVGTLLVVGGETVTHLCQMMNVESIELLGEIQPGIPFGILRGGKLEGIKLVTKAGGFGDEVTLANILFNPEPR